MKKIIFCFLILFSFGGCFFNNREKLYYKYIQTSQITIEWFFYSTLSNTTPDYVIVNIKGVADTLCVANNIVDVNLQFNTINIIFDGFPQKYGNPIEIKSSISEYSILIDTAKIEKKLIKKDFFKMNSVE